MTTLLFSALVRPWMVLCAKLGSATVRPFPFSCLGAMMMSIRVSELVVSVLNSKEHRKKDVRRFEGGMEIRCWC